MPLTRSSRSRSSSRSWPRRSRRRTNCSISSIGTWQPRTSIWQRRRTGDGGRSSERAEPVSKGCSSWWTFLRLSRLRNARPSRQSSSRRSYDEGETLVEPGVVLQSLFIIGSGVVSLTREGIEGEMELLRLGPGDHFGEIGMLTGEAATARISALVPTTVYELAKADLTPILEARPPVAQELCRALARLQAAGRLSASPELDEQRSEAPPDGLVFRPDSSALHRRQRRMSEPLPNLDRDAPRSDDAPRGAVGLSTHRDSDVISSQARTQPEGGVIGDRC